MVTTKAAVVYSYYLLVHKTFSDRVLYHPSCKMLEEVRYRSAIRGDHPSLSLIVAVIRGRGGNGCDKSVD